MSDPLIESRTAAVAARPGDVAQRQHLAELLPRAHEPAACLTKRRLL
ncbi:hypothetical protein [Actinoplanes sp. NPDC049599]